MIYINGGDDEKTNTSALLRIQVHTNRLKALWFALYRDKVARFSLKKSPDIFQQSIWLFLTLRLINRNEEIRTRKAGLSGIVRQYGFATVQDFYTTFYTAQRATEAYQNECAKWEEAYGEKATPKAETMHEKIQKYKEKVDRQNVNRPYQSRDKGAR